jgi:dienelactone hydrolase
MIAKQCNQHDCLQYLRLCLIWIKSKRRKTISLLPWIFALFACACPVNGQDEEILNILHEQGNMRNYRSWLAWSDGPLMLIHHLNSQSIACIDRREAAVARLQTAQDWRRRQQQVREYFTNNVGPWPGQTPLNPRITSTVSKPGYRVETIVYESMPGFFVTGALFIPAGHRGKGPAILNVIGHSAQAFRLDTHQNVILNLVHKGFIVFAIDPIGQGERLQYFNPATGKSDVGRSTAEHSHAGIQCFLIGRSIARYFTWDGIRAIDYLCTRPEVDPDRIGVTGLSGGGTQSSYIGAMDERIAAAAPAGYIVGYRRLLESIGPGDAEQVFYLGLTSGIDHADLLEVRAPKPTLHVTTTRDFFSIQGARETEREARKAFEVLGEPSAYRRVEDDHIHGFTRKNNEATYAFFQKALDLPGDPQEHTYPFLTEEELTVTSTGQVSTALEGETVFSINQREALPMLRSLTAARKDIESHAVNSVQAARRLSGFHDVANDLSTPVYRGRYRRDGYTLEKWGMHGEGEYIIPMLVAVPDGEGPFPAVMYTHPEGKIKEALPGGQIERLVQQGYIVAAADLLGFGETSPSLGRGIGLVQPFFNAQLAGRSVVGINAGDALRVFHFLKQRPDVSAKRIGAVAVGFTGPAVLHAAAFETGIAWLVLTGTLLSYESLVLNTMYRVNANSLVAGALTAYDLPDLIGSLAPRRIALLNSVDYLGKPALETAVRSSAVFPLAAFSHADAEQNIRMVTDPTVDITDLVAWGLGKQ